MSSADTGESDSLVGALSPCHVALPAGLWELGVSCYGQTGHCDSGRKPHGSRPQGVSSARQGLNRTELAYLPLAAV